MKFLVPLVTTCLLLFCDSAELSARQPPRRASARVTRPKAYPVLDAATKEKILKAHNQLRAQAGVPPLEWSDEISKYSQEWADYLATHGCAMQHRPAEGPYRQIFGENLYIATVYFYDPVEGVYSWHAEKKLYDGSPLTMSNFHPVGHYTQLMWNSTTKVGAGLAVCGRNFILVCNYDPPGNVIGQTPF